MLIHNYHVWTSRRVCTVWASKSETKHCESNVKKTKKLLKNEKRGRNISFLLCKFQNWER